MKRVKIIKALTELLKTISTDNGYKTELLENAFPFLRFWDEVQNFPSIYLTAGTEVREYHPANFAWAFLSVSVKIYTKGEDTCQEQLENLLEDIELLINRNTRLVFDGGSTEEILITSITTDEGLLNPYGVGEINLQVRYPIDY